MEKIRLGFAPTRRFCFSVEDAHRFKDIILEKLRKDDRIEVIDIEDINEEGLVRPSVEDVEKIADKFIDLLQIKTASRETLIKQLSGGNQQKVILARWLATNPDFLILDEPTRGIDVGTKTEIQKLVIQLAEEGKSIIFVSSEIEEMLRVCNKMAVLRDGAKVGEISGDMTQEMVMSAIAGGEAK